MGIIILTLVLLTVLQDANITVLGHVGIIVQILVEHRVNNP